MTENFKEKVKVFSQLSIILAFLIAFLIFARVILIPILLAMLLSIVLNPLLKRIETLGVGRILSIVLVLLTSLIVIGGILTYSGFQMSQLAKDLPALEAKAVMILQQISDSLESNFGISSPQQDRWLSQLGDSAGRYITGILQTTSSIVTALALIPIYVFLMLLYKGKVRVFLGKLNLSPTTSAAERINEIKGVVQNYVFGMFIVIGILAVLNSIGLLLLGIKYALFFGIFSALLTVIPYIGNLIGGSLPVLMALATKDSYWYAVGVIAVYAFVQFLEGNFITPNIMGSKVRINPLVALISLLTGAHILGVVGMILAIPLIGIIKIILSHSQTLSPFVVLMEERDSN